VLESFGDGVVEEASIAVVNRHLGCEEQATSRLIYYNIKQDRDELASLMPLVCLVVFRGIREYQYRVYLR
jgi:hypothetical protein